MKPVPAHINATFLPGPLMSLPHSVRNVLQGSMLTVMVESMVAIGCRIGLPWGATVVDQITSMPSGSQIAIAKENRRPVWVFPSKPSPPANRRDDHGRGHIPNRYELPTTAAAAEAYIVAFATTGAFS